MLKTIIDLWNKYDYVYIDGLIGTLWLAAITVFIATILGTIIAIMKLSEIKILDFITAVYIGVLRGTPILLQLYFFWLVLPKITPFELSDTACIVIALIVNASAYVAEIIRAGIQAVDKGQTEAAKSLGLSNSNTMKKIILPQAIKNILPALGNEFVTLVKESAIVSFVGIADIMFVANTVKNSTYKAFGPYLFAALIYFIITFTLSKAIALLEKKMTVDK